MHPLLIELFNLPIRAYGAFVGAALVTSMALVVRYGRRSGLSGDRMLDAAYAGVIAGLVGGRLMYIIVHAPDFQSNPLSALRVWEGGMMYFGGLVLGTIVGCFVAVRLGLSLWRAGDSMAPAIGAGQAVGRVACLVAGCCYGKCWENPLAITFHDPLAAVPSSMMGVGLIPTQVLQILEGLFLWWLGAWLYRHKRWDGQAFLYTLAAAGTTRALLEELRGDAARGFLLPSVFGEALPSSRVVGIALVLAAVLMTVVRRGQQRGATGAKPAEA
ncbi:MAG TPA: prolipoprotein diacylglyceryl transferase family protein [bacterium]|nr:prolipoprotein diacylglyceryl transferase family protein [bacterium]